VDISVTISGNKSTATRTLTGTWTSGLILPTVTSVSPKFGPLAAGTAITITGTNFVAGGSSVTVGGGGATSVVVVSPTSVTAITPAGTAGQKSVLVTTAGTSVVTNAPATNFNYQTIPTCTAMSPTNMPAAGGTINFTGTGFLSVSQISFNLTTTNLTNIVINSDTSITATCPARSATVGWLANVVKGIIITNPSGSKNYGGTAALGFYYTS
jgi:hypothetical protein